MLFRGAVEASLPSSIRAIFKQVVGLSGSDFHMWTSDVTQYIDNELEKRDQEEKD